MDLRCLAGIHDMTWGITHEGYHDWCRRKGCDFRVDRHGRKREELIPVPTLLVESLEEFISDIIRIVTRRRNG